MTEYAIKNAGELKTALAKAQGGDVLKLAAGNYGDVTISKKFAADVTIVSADKNNPAVFKHMLVKDSANVVLDGLSFKGGVNGRGLEVKGGSGITVSDSDFSDTTFGATFLKVRDLEVKDNDFTKMWHDAMRFVSVEDARITGNTYIEKDSQPGYTHKDFIQFWTNKANGEYGSKNVLISGNTFISDDGETHGIFLLAEGGPAMGYHQNIVIADNTIKASQTHAITVAYANGLTITGNTVEPYGKIGSGGVPVINVTPDSLNVKVTYNTAPSVPNQGNGTWTVAGNKETGSVNAWHWTGNKTGSKVENTGSPVGAGGDKAPGKAPGIPAPDTGQGAEGNGKATEFRHDGSKISGNKAGTISGLDFGEGDTLVFIHYDKGTVADRNGGNLVWNNAEATYAKIDSLTDLQEIDAFSKLVSTKVAGDDLILTIKQDTGTQTLTLEDWGREFIATYDASLF